MFDIIGVFIILFFVYGLGIGFLIAFTFIGLIAGLIGLLLFNRKIVMFPNPKISIFVGYVAFTVLFTILPFALLLSSSYSSYSPSSLSFLILFFSLPLILL